MTIQIDENTVTTDELVSEARKVLYDVVGPASHLSIQEKRIKLAEAARLIEYAQMQLGPSIIDADLAKRINRRIG